MVTTSQRTRSAAAGALTLLALLLAFAPLAARADAPLTNADCFGCHNEPSMTMDRAGKQVSVFVDEKKFGGSVHGSLSCTDCHADIKAVPHEKVAPVNCAGCHPEAQAAYDSSVHAAARKAGDRQAATCIDCHGSPHLVTSSSDKTSRAYRTNVPQMCGACHGQKFAMSQSGISTQILFGYKESVHGKAVAAGSMKAAICTDCHSNHAIVGPGDPKSPVFKFNVPRTCGTCHPAIANQFWQSVHGKAITHGNWEAPVCTNCHGIHLIRQNVDPRSPVNANRLAEATCAPCHGGVRMSQEFGVASERVTSYEASYHGLARKMGSTVAANCASCHGVHNILPSSDPASMVSKQNLAKTCGQCHKGAAANFINGKVHVQTSAIESTTTPRSETQTYVLGWVRRIYLSLIFLTIGGMLAHNLIIWVRKAIEAKRSSERVIPRASVQQRVQHAFLVVSFFTLVITGFALKYPDSVFAVVSGGSEAIRRIVHRIAAVVMMALGVYHVIYAVGTKEGRRDIRDFWFSPKDATDAVQMMWHYITGKGHAPRMGRFTYGEKAEYWAVAWGTFVMGATGLMIWYNVAAARWFPRWWIDVATAIHFYEAILATLAIIVWHFYNVIFDPDIYPISWTWLDGKMDRHYFEHEHGAEYDQMMRDNATRGSQGGEWNGPKPH